MPAKVGPKELARRELRRKAAQEPASAPIPAAADIFSSDLNKRLEAMRDPALVAVAALLGVTPSELCASLRYYLVHKGAVARHRNRKRAQQPG